MCLELMLMSDASASEPRSKGTSSWSPFLWNSGAQVLPGFWLLASLACKEPGKSHSVALCGVCWQLSQEVEPMPQWWWLREKVGTGGSAWAA